jgi:ABC-type multidrug transport system fused ATPase/permease subunit
MTIEENIKLGNDDITTADMVQACKIANCHEFIKNLPKVL